MAERGTTPQVPVWQRRGLHAIRAFFSPFLPDDYISMINPLWTTQELRGRVEKVKPEAGGAATVLIRPGFDWAGHAPGQYVRIGVEIDGRHHWRAYSLTSAPDREDGLISITPKLVDEGKVSPFYVREIRPGHVVRLGEVEGTFTLPDPLPQKLLFVSAGSGITPIMSMLRHLSKTGGLTDAVHLHSARAADEVIFGDELRAMVSEHEGLRLHEQHTGAAGRMTPEHLDELCPDWRERETFVCGPRELLEALQERFEEDGEADPERLHFEAFQPIIGGDGGEGSGGEVRFISSELETQCDAGTPILVAGEEAGASLPFGCRMGVCHTCVGRLASGQVRDLRTGEVTGAEGQMIRTCVNAAEGPVEIHL